MARKTSELAQLGDIVTVPPRADGYAHRHGDDAKWEVISIMDNYPDVVTLRLVGGTAHDTCGASRKSLTIAK